MDETELGILLCQQVNEYGMGFIKNEIDGSRTLISPKDVLVYTRSTNMPPDMLESKSLHDMLMNMTLMELNIPERKPKCQNCGTEIEEPGECDDCSGLKEPEDPPCPDCSGSGCGACQPEGGS